MIPGYQSIMLPLLEALSDGQDHRLRDLIGSLAQSFSLTKDEREQLLPSGRQAVFDNRVNWAKTYLGKAGLLMPVGRGVVRVSDSGRSVLAEQPSQLDSRYLTRFPEFQAFRSVSRKPAPIPTARSETPEEELEAIWQTLRDQTADDLLALVKAVTPTFFERLVVDVLVAMGYGGSRTDAAESVGRSGDGGIDGIIKEDKLGLDAIYVQAKRWDGVVGRPVVQAFAGSLEGVRARKGVLITTSTFSAEADAYVKQIEKKIVLIDGQRLMRLMFEHGVGVTTSRTYEIMRVDSDYFEP